MPSASRTPRAQRDIDQIAYRIGSDSVGAMLKWLKELERITQLLSDFPGMGPRRPELSPDLRSYPHGSYIIFYRPAPDGIEIMRVLHGAQDIPEIIGDDA